MQSYYIILFKNNQKNTCTCMYVHTQMNRNGRRNTELRKEQTSISHSASKSLHGIGRLGSDLLFLKFIFIKCYRGEEELVSNVYVVLLCFPAQVSYFKQMSHSKAKMSLECFVLKEIISVINAFIFRSTRFTFSHVLLNWKNKGQHIVHFTS